MKTRLEQLVLIAGLVVGGNSLQAALTVSFQQTGKANWSIDAIGGNGSPVGSVTVSVPAGSTVVKAVLYSTRNFTLWTPDVTLDATNYSGGVWTFLGGLENFLEAYSTDVTAQVAAKVGGGGPPVNFTVTESAATNGSTNGEILAVVYTNPAELTRTIVFLDGVQDAAGDTTVVNYAVPLDTTIPGFEALMSLGIGHGFQGGMRSFLDVNTRRLTSSAGGQDDGASANGALITVGGLGDSSANPPDPNSFVNGQTGQDDEFYDLGQGNNVNPAPYVSNGDLATTIFIQNLSNDDIIFFLGLNITVPVQDSDGDGIPDDEDACPESILTATIIIDGCDSGVGNLLFEDGCTMADLIAECAEGAVNHGQVVSCVAHLTNEWKRAGLIEGQEEGRIQSCAARSDIPGDLDGDGAVGVADLVILLGAWGPCRAHPDACPADVDLDDIVGITDLLILLANWG